MTTTKKKRTKTLQETQQHNINKVEQLFTSILTYTMPTILIPVEHINERIYNITLMQP